jgi:hypothetical protein
MTSLLSDMRMVRPQGLTFRITQPHGLRIWYLRTAQGQCKWRASIIIFEIPNQRLQTAPQNDEAANCGGQNQKLRSGFQ